MTGLFVQTFSFIILLIVAQTCYVESINFSGGKKKLFIRKSSSNPLCTSVSIIYSKNQCFWFAETIQELTLTVVAQHLVPVSLNLQWLLQEPF